ncbi:MAG: hypothetical protein H7Y00_01555 [Fimbriimonadaceae bacterium]|nr:hypothetical protein [Chitinophagales bacterium]
MSCNKHDGMFGGIDITGKVCDIISGYPIEGAVVTLNSSEWKKGPLGYTLSDGTILLTDTTDNMGKYSFSFLADGEYQFEVYAYSYNELYSISDHSIVAEIGEHIKDLECKRSAWAKIFLLNETPVDTPYFISLSGNLPETTVLNNFYNDTIVHLKLIGNSLNQLRFNEDNENDIYLDVTPSDWDTIELEFKY